MPKGSLNCQYYIDFYEQFANFLLKIPAINETANLRRYKKYTFSILCRR